VTEVLIINFERNLVCSRLLDSRDGENYKGNPKVRRVGSGEKRADAFFAFVFPFGFSATSESGTG